MSSTNFKIGFEPDLEYDKIISMFENSNYNHCGVTCSLDQTVIHCFNKKETLEISKWFINDYKVKVEGTMIILTPLKPQDILQGQSKEIREDLI
jgi:hypothetical protein